MPKKKKAKKKKGAASPTSGASTRSQVAAEGGPALVLGLQAEPRLSPPPEKTEPTLDQRYEAVYLVAPQLRPEVVSGAKAALPAITTKAVLRLPAYRNVAINEKRIYSWKNIVKKGGVLHANVGQPRAVSDVNISKLQKELNDRSQQNLPPLSKRELEERVKKLASATRKDAGHPVKMQQARKPEAECKGDADEGKGRQAKRRRVQHLSDKTMGLIIRNAVRHNKKTVTTAARYNAVRDLKQAASNCAMSLAVILLPGDGEGIHPSLCINSDATKISRSPDGKFHIKNEQFYNAQGIDTDAPVGSDYKFTSLKNEDGGNPKSSSMQRSQVGVTTLNQQIKWWESICRNGDSAPAIFAATDNNLPEETCLRIEILDGLGLFAREPTYLLLTKKWGGNKAQLDEVLKILTSFINSQRDRLPARKSGLTHFALWQTDQEGTQLEVMQRGFNDMAKEYIIASTTAGGTSFPAQPCDRKDLFRMEKYFAKVGVPYKRADGKEMEALIKAGTHAAYAQFNKEEKKMEAEGEEKGIDPKRKPVTRGPKNIDFIATTIVHVSEARKVVMASGQVARESWAESGFANVDQTINNLKMFRAVDEEDEKLLRSKMPELVDEYLKNGYPKEETLSSLFSDWPTLSTHVGMDDEKHSRRATIPSHEQYRERWLKYTEAKKVREAEEKKAAIQRGEKKAEKRAKDDESKMKKKEEEGKRTALRAHALRLPAGPARGKDWKKFSDRKCPDCSVWMSQCEGTAGLEHHRGKYNHWAGCDYCETWYCGDHKGQLKVHERACNTVLEGNAPMEM